jgi:hypothetical protein
LCAIERCYEVAIDLANTGQVRSMPGAVVWEDGLAYELEVLATGWRLGLHDSDWENLLGLAHQYGWRPAAGLDHYLHDGGKRIVSPSDARALARALEGALQDLPPERRKGLRPYMGALRGLDDERYQSGPGADYEDYFSWQRRWMVEEVMRLCRRGAVEIRPM